MYTSDDKELASTCLQFMQRATLQGSEVNAFTVICNWLMTIANPAPADTERE